MTTSMSGKGAIAETDPLALGVSSAYTSGHGGRGELALGCLRDADVVLVVGSDLDQLATTEWCWPSADAQLIRVDIDPSELIALPGINLWGDAGKCSPSSSPPVLPSPRLVVRSGSRASVGPPAMPPTRYVRRTSPAMRRARSGPAP